MDDRKTIQSFYYPCGFLVNRFCFHFHSVFVTSAPSPFSLFTFYFQDTKTEKHTNHFKISEVLFIKFQLFGVTSRDITITANKPFCIAFFDVAQLEFSEEGSM